MTSRFAVVWGLILTALLSSSPVTVSAAEVSGIRETHHTLQTARGSFQFTLRRSLNEHGEMELTVLHEELRLLFPTLLVPVLYARDTDGDKKMDLWLVPTSAGSIDSIERDSKDFDGWDVASQLLQNEIDIANRPVWTLLIQATQSGLTFNGAMASSFFAKITRTQMDLYDLDARADRIRVLNPREQGLMETYALISEGWRKLDDQIVNEGIRKHILATLADMGMVGAGAAAARGARFVVGWVGPRILESQAGELALQTYERLATSIHQSARTAVERAAALFPAGARLTRSLVTDSAAHATFVRLSVESKVATRIAALEARGLAGRLAIRGLKASGRVLKQALKQWPYVAQTTASQLVAELSARRATLFDPSPIVMAHNVVSDRDLLQNLAYMTNETLLTAGASASDPNLRRRFTVCGIISFVDSGAMNYAVKGGGDPGRIGLDTGWEIIIGNSQTQADIAALQLFEKLSVRNSNPRLKVLGYAVALVDQLAGYFAYSEVTQRYERTHAVPHAQDKPMVKLIPILAN